MQGLHADKLHNCEFTCLRELSTPASVQGEVVDQLHANSDQLASGAAAAQAALLLLGAAALLR